MDAEVVVLGDEPLNDGMRVSVRFRRDFIVVDADRVLAAARRAYLTLHTQATPDDAARGVTCAADAVFTLLETDGLLGDAVDARLAARADDGLQVAGWVAEFVGPEMNPLVAGGCANCL